VVVHGHLVALGRPEELGAGAASSIVSFRLPEGVAVDELPRLDGTLSRDGADLELTTTAPTRTLQELTTWAVARNVEVPSLSVGRPSLEDTYLALVAKYDGQSATAGEPATEPVGTAA
jgi:ABC-2 type transport system ATP-binding protein